MDSAFTLSRVGARKVYFYALCCDLVAKIALAITLYNFLKGQDIFVALPLDRNGRLYIDQYVASHMCWND